MARRAGPWRAVGSGNYGEVTGVELSGFVRCRGSANHTGRKGLWPAARARPVLLCQAPRSGGNQPAPCHFVRSGKSALMG